MPGTGHYGFRGRGKPHQQIPAKGRTIVNLPKLKEGGPIKPDGLLPAQNGVNQVTYHGPNSKEMGNPAIIVEPPGLRRSTRGAEANSDK